MNFNNKENWRQPPLILDWGIFGHAWRFVLIDGWVIEKSSGQPDGSIHNLCALVLTNQPSQIHNNNHFAKPQLANAWHFKHLQDH